MKRTLSVVLLLSMLLSAMSCGSETSVSVDDTTAEEDGDTTGKTTAPVDELEARQLVDDELPKKDFGGESYVIAAEAKRERFIDVESTNGEVVNDAIYQRNREIEDRFNVKIEYILSDDYTVLSKDVAKAITAGDDSFDMVCGHVVNLGMLTLEGYFRNWYDIEYVDFDKPWWAKATTENLSYNDVCILAVGDFALSALANTYCMYVNMNLAEDYQIPDVRETVMDGGWTIDYLIQLSKDIYKDVNNNGIADEHDFYGFCSNASSNANAFLWSFDNPIITNTAAGELEVTFKTEKVSDIVSKLVNMFKDNDGISYNLNYVDPDGNVQFSYPRYMFLDSKCIFATGNIFMSIDLYRDMNDEYSIIPYPKWDENQEEYYTMVDGSHSVMAVPMTVADTEFVGIITEALCAESYKQVVPAYYDVAMKVKGARDETSLEILDMLVQNRVFDMGYVYDGGKGASFIIQSLVRTENTNFESYWAGKESSIMQHYDTVIEFFENYGE